MISIGALTRPISSILALAAYLLAATQHVLLLQVPTMHQILLARAEKDFPRDRPPPLRFIRSCSSSLAAPTLHKLEAAFNVPVLEVHSF